MSDNNVQEVKPYNKGGRPNKDGAKRDKRYPLRLTVSDKRLLQNAADAQDKSLGAFVRESASKVIVSNKPLMIDGLSPSNETMVGILMTNTEKEEFTKAANTAGISLNAFLRGIALMAAAVSKNSL